MSYVSRNLVPGETVSVTGQVHWIIYAKPAAGLLAAIIMAAASMATDVPVLRVGAVLLALGSLWSMAQAWLYAITTELAVTTKRAIAKWGFIRRNTVELNLSKVESFHVNQSILGRLLNYGSISIHGIGATDT
ncbi:PH domain-containing protein, partial [Azospirillum sp. B4]|uniref:PH domain-containing protein n=1 Tax=Azospirillum sp. B4 TaxID=95605 RepID=UPI0005C9CD28